MRNILVLLPKQLRVSLTFLLGIILSGCIGPQLYQQQLSALDKGISQTQSISRLNLPPLSTSIVSVANRTFEFQRYLLNNGVQFDVYYLAFEQQKLVYWGYITEFRRQPDHDLNEAMTLVLKEVKDTKN